MNKRLYIILITLFMSFLGIAQQINIGRVDLMPNKPYPYIMRDWKKVAIGYDSLVYDVNAVGQFLPITRLYSNTVNYPEHGSFYQYTYIGAPYATQNESINSFMGIIGATLCGVDKRNHYGQNWVLMCEEHFNRANKVNLYGDNVGSRTGGDWWYELIPNVLFYQLYDLYPLEGHFKEQFPIVADRWLECVKALGGSSTPWNLPYMNYRAFNFDTMKPLLGGVPEPEAAGAIGWLLYSAYTKTGIEKYRVGAELCMENYSSLTENPSYELQYLYGTVAAARMNAELGTNYDLNKMMNWCFDVGPLRKWAHTNGWGTVVGRWNNMDLSGIMAAISQPGNTDFGDYAFLMNTFQIGGILPPVVRYDDRYARAIGKFVLNLANSARIFYPNFLPVENQDANDWSKKYDPNSYIAYEAVRQFKNGKSPFATGDAFKAPNDPNNWAETNLSLYSSSPVGYIGSILETTNVEAILKIDLLKTDFFHNKAYPTYLYYNPYNVEKSVNIDLGNGSYTLYNAVTNTVISTSASGIHQLKIPADNAVVLVLAPANGVITFDHTKTLIDGVVVDYIGHQNNSDYPPRIKAISSNKELALYGERINLFCSATDKEGDYLRYQWSLNGQSLPNTIEQISWTTPNKDGEYIFSCTVTDLKNLSTTSSIKIKVVSKINTPPVISKITADPLKIKIASSTSISCIATDIDNDVLKYNWKDNQGNVLSSSANFTWQAPSETGIYTFHCYVDDQAGGLVDDSIQVIVYDPSIPPSGNLVAYYPFSNGSIKDLSGNNNDCILSKDITPTSDKFGVNNQSLYFNGNSSYLKILNSPSLNSKYGVTVALWMKMDKIISTEQYPISFGLWDHRWKISTFSNLVKWTLKTTDIVKDVITITPINSNQWVQIVGTYDGVSSAVYLNGKMESVVNQSGTIPQSGVDLIIGRAYVDNDGYNFAGALDDIRIYDYALSDNQILSLYNQTISDVKSTFQDINAVTISPNPCQDVLKIKFNVNSPSDPISVDLFNLQGSKVVSLFTEKRLSGVQEIECNVSELLSGIYLCRINNGGKILYTKIIKK